MGEMIRQHYWIPAVPASKLVADGAPLRVRLLGGNYVAFRATDGRVGVIDEQCPHRRASLALAHNEDNGLRCLYHGWKINVHGEVVEAPNHAGDQKQFCEHVRVNRYGVAGARRHRLGLARQGRHGRRSFPTCRSSTCPTSTAR